MPGDRSPCNNAQQLMLAASQPLWQMASGKLWVPGPCSLPLFKLKQLRQSENWCPSELEKYLCKGCGCESRCVCCSPVHVRPSLLGTAHGGQEASTVHPPPGDVMRLFPPSVPKVPFPSQKPSLPLRCACHLCPSSLKVWPRRKARPPGSPPSVQAFFCLGQSEPCRMR